jgi:tRNA(Ile)-lysidine synthetase-like protein
VRKIDLRKAVSRAWLELPESLRKLPVYVAVSGGGDSTALAAVSLELRGHFPSLSWLHVNYRLRRPDSDREEAHLRSWAKVEKVPLHALRLNPKSKPQNLQAWARDRRLRFFAEVLRKNSKGRGLIWLAHHEQDQAETVLLRLIRGAGLRGLGGMETLDKLEVALPRGTRVLHLFRPLLSVPKEAIQRYLQAHRLRFFEDRTNRLPSYWRNRVRHRILPLLIEENPRAVEALCELASRATQAAGALDAWARQDLMKNFNKNKKTSNLSIKIFKENPPGLGPFLLENFLKVQGWEGEALSRQTPRILRALSSRQPPQILTFKGGKQLEVGVKGLRVLSRSRKKKF